jgi:hypothetical protein
MLVLALVLLPGAVFAQDAKGLTVSGILDSSVNMYAGAGAAPAFSYGFEEYANLRMQAKIRDRAVFYGAVNFIAAAGTSAAAAAPFFGTAGENYIAGFELERLYFRLNGEYLDFDGGLMRIPFGYGQVWGPSDFLNPKNPLQPDARPRGVLGAGLAWYPLDETKIFFFGAAPKDPFALDGAGGMGGVSAERHWEKFSVQALYAGESPRQGSSQGLHRMGISLKADLVLGWVFDMLYTANPETGAALGGLSASAGCDYSFFDGKFLVLAEYLYNGENSSTSKNSGNSLGLSNNNYLMSSLSYFLNDYTTISAALVSGFDDLSFTPVLSVDHDLFQGLTLSISAQVPMDGDLVRKDGSRGELGPLPPQPPGQAAQPDMGAYFILTAKARLRF